VKANQKRVEKKRKTGRTTKRKGKTKRGRCGRTSYEKRGTTPLTAGRQSLKYKRPDGLMPQEKRKERRAKGGKEKNRSKHEPHNPTENSVTSRSKKRNPERWQVKKK